MCILQKVGSSMDLLYRFSTALLQARQRKDATQEQVAWAIGVSHATYNAWECGHRLCPYKHVIALIDYFDDECAAWLREQEDLSDMR